MSAMEKFGTIILAIVAFVVVTLAATFGSGLVAGILDSAGIVLSDQAYLAMATALGLLSSGYVLGVFD